MIRLLLLLAFFLIGYGLWMQYTNTLTAPTKEKVYEGGINGLLESADDAARAMERGYNGSQ